MINDDAVISLPFSNLSEIEYKSGEDINFLTINDKLIKLLENDKYIYNIKKDVSKTAVKNYNLLSYFDTYSIDEYKSLIWNQTIENINSDILVFPSVNSKKHINILFPIIPPNNTSHISIVKWDNPTKIPDSISNINLNIHNQISANDNLTTYDSVLKKVYDAHIIANTGDSSTSGNIVRYDAAYFASLNRHECFNQLYNAGYRWAEILMTEDSIANLSAITKHISSPHLELTTNNTTGVTSTEESTYGVVTNNTINQYILNDNYQKTVNSYSDGTWVRYINSEFVTFGGITQITPTITVDNNSISSITFEPSAINYNIELPSGKTINVLNVIVNSYNCTNSLSSITNPNMIYSCPVLISNINNDKFTIKINPDYVTNNNIISTAKEFSQFNIVWKAEGLLTNA